MKRIPRRKIRINLTSQTHLLRRRTPRKSHSSTSRLMPSNSKKSMWSEIRRSEPSDLAKIRYPGMSRVMRMKKLIGMTRFYFLTFSIDDLKASTSMTFRTIPINQILPTEASRLRRSLGPQWAFRSIEDFTTYFNYNEGMRAPTVVELSCADPSAPCTLPKFCFRSPPQGGHRRNP